MKQYILKFYNSFMNFIKYNKQFCSYIILSVLCALLLRINTSGNIDFSPLVFDIAMAILIGSLCYLLKPKKQFNYLLVCLIILAIICIINSIYYEFYSSYVSFSLITALSQVGEVEDALFEKIKIIQFIYLLIPIIFFMINKRLNGKDYFNYVTKLENSKKLFRSVLVSGILLFGFASAITPYWVWSSLTKQWNREYIVNHFGITIYQLNDLLNTLKPTINSWVGYDIAYKNFKDYYEENKLEKSNNEYTDKFKDYNVIFVHMESITTFLVNLEVNGLEITPNLNYLAKDGMYFSNFYPQIGPGTSSDTEFTLSTSLMPAISGTAFVSYYDREYVTLQKLLKDKGYYTFSMHANKASMWNRNNMHPSLGYMDFYSSTSFEIDEEIGLGLSDKSFFRQSIPILENIEKNNNKYMGTVITLTNHTPFENNELFKQIDLTFATKAYNSHTNKYEDTAFNYLEGTKLGDYIRSAHYADEALGEFINYIKESEYFNNTIFVFYGDHDPKLDLKEFYNYYNYDFNTGEILKENDPNYINYDYYANELNKKTPLIIWTKNEPLATEISYYMGMIDVMPTVGNMLGVYNEYALGHDIFEIKNDNIVAFPNGNYLTNKVYYRHSKDEYKPLDLDEILSEDYISAAEEYTDKIISISDGIITHDLIKASQNKDNAVELK